MSNVVNFPGWRANLAKNVQGNILPTFGNVLLAMRYDEVIRDMVGYDVFCQRPVILRAPPIGTEADSPMPGPYPRIWEPHDVVLITSYLQLSLCHSLTQRVTEQALVATAASNRFHPVVEHLNTLVWDGRPRLDIWLQAVFGAPDTPYIRAVGAKFLIAAVRRVKHPGIKFDVMIVLEGLQGLGKSRALRELFYDRFTDRMPRDLDSADAVRAMVGIWCVELAENDQIIRGNVETIKAFLSRSVDRVVPKYLNEAKDIPRQSVIAGTTNRDDYLRDVTGNRRFWPVPCVAAAIEWITLNRDDLWAEAVAREAAGENIFLDDELTIEAGVMQADRVIEDTWENRIHEWALTRTEIRLADVLSDALSIPIERHDRRSQLRAGDCLRRLGWQKHNKGAGGRSIGKVWTRKDEES